MPDGDGGAWDAALYDDGHSFVYEYGEDVLELLAPDEGERILDLGCGTGHLTRRIADAGAEAVGVDSSREMVGTARAEHPDLPFVRADARAIAFAEPFDAVFSNAMLHWVDGGDQDAVLDGVHGVLRPGGRFVAELGGTGNVGTIVGALLGELSDRGYDAESPWYFPSVGEYASRLERRGFEVRYARLFDRPTELEGGESGLRDWIAMFGDAFFEPLAPDEREAVLAAVEDRLRPDLFRDGTWVADYRRLRVVAYRVDR